MERFRLAVRTVAVFLHPIFKIYFVLIIIPFALMLVGGYFDVTLGIQVGLCMLAHWWLFTDHRTSYGR